MKHRTKSRSPLHFGGGALSRAGFTRPPIGVGRRIVRGTRAETAGNSRSFRFVSVAGRLLVASDFVAKEEEI